VAGVSGGRSATAGSSLALQRGLGPGSKLGGTERAPASWRWEKQELERQLKDYRKKLDDIYAEMKRNQVKWKAAGEDIARVHMFLPSSLSFSFCAFSALTLLVGWQEWWDSGVVVWGEVQIYLWPS